MSGIVCKAARSLRIYPSLATLDPGHRRRPIDAALLRARAMAQKHWHLVSYDVRDPKRLRKVAKKLEGYGTRVQYSVFRCRLDRETLEKLHWELNQIMEDADDLLVIPLCDCCAGKVPEHSTGDQTSWAAPTPTYRVI